MAMTRDELIYLLTEAAELEHLLCCSYLFAAFSTKRNNDEFDDPEHSSKVISWTQSISYVARQEMEHMALVNNILTSIGGTPHFRRPALPLPDKYSLAPLALERLSIQAVDRFIAYEKPDPDYQPSHQIRLMSLETEVAPKPVRYTSLGELYAKILAGIKTFPGGDKALFIGPAGAQISGQQLNLDFPRLGQLGGVFGVTIFDVTDSVTAEAAIELIVEQGEGGPEIPEEGSHYWRFCEIKREMEADQNFDPAYPVVPNPVLYETPGVVGQTVVTHEGTRAVMDLFNAAYETTLLLLIRLYLNTDQTPKEADALRYAAFFPMMTQVIRPLGEILVSLPAFEDDRPERAGPSFEVFRSIDFLPHKQAAWTVLNERFAEMTADCTSLAKRMDHERMAFTAESLSLISQKFAFMIDQANTAEGA